MEITALKKDLKGCNFKCNFGKRKLQIKNQYVTLV
nr:MAG TPA: Radical SAM superfamily [Caudoviricetes sp.]